MFASARERVPCAHPWVCVLRICIHGCAPSAFASTGVRTLYLHPREFARSVFASVGVCASCACNPRECALQQLHPRVCVPQMHPRCVQAPIQPRVCALSVCIHGCAFRSCIHGVCKRHCSRGSHIHPRVCAYEFAKFGFFGVPNHWGGVGRKKGLLTGSDGIGSERGVVAVEKMVEEMWTGSSQEGTS